MSADVDVCVVGSGAGGGPVALSVARAGYSVVVLEKGPWLRDEDFTKDEIGECLRSKYTPNKRLEPQVIETPDGTGGFVSAPTSKTRWDFWNGTMVGGATNLMSGFFLRMKPEDFRLRSTYGPVEGADVVDWPISYDDLEPWYDLVEREVGVSGRVAPHPLADRRSSRDFPLPPLDEHPFAEWLDRTAPRLGIHPFPVPRAILSEARVGRAQCLYTGYCGSYGCTTGATGSSRAALLPEAVATGRCDVRPRATARRVLTDSTGRATGVEYHDAQGAVHVVTARIVVVACQAIESARLLLLSTGPRHPNGLGNGSGRVGRNLIFSPDGAGWGEFPYAKFPSGPGKGLRSTETFVNRAVQDWYSFEGPSGGRRRKGGTLDFLLKHPNPIGASLSLATWDQVKADEAPIWGAPLKEKLRHYFRDVLHLRFEIFADWMPVENCRVMLSPSLKDPAGVPVAHVRVEGHPYNREAAAFLCARGAEVLRAMGAENVRTYENGGPSTNLVAGTCRFGADPRTSVLDPDCRVHEADNVFVTDGSFMPTGGSVPYTFTIYANSFRVAEKIVRQLGGPQAATAPKPR